MELQGLEKRIKIKRNSEIHSALKYSMVLCRFMGFFPVSGLYERTNERLEFKFKSVLIIYNVMTIICQMFMCVMSIHHFIVKELSLLNTSNLLFSSIGLLSTMLLSKLAREWPQFMAKLTGLERNIPPFINCRTFKQCNILCLSFMSLAMVEHVLSIHFHVTFVTHCPIKGTVTESYYYHTIPSVFSFTSFTLWKAILTEIVKIQTTFLWTFIDMLIMMFSYYLKSLFQQLNKHINRKKAKASTAWDVLRAQYSNIVSMVRLIDCHLNGIILLSFFTNLFYICLQLFNTLNLHYPAHYLCNKETLNRALNGIEHRIYYTYSFLFLVFRAYSVSIIAANINNSAHKAQFALCDVPAPAYSLDVQRFHRQVTYTTVALSGLNFFYVTKKMILKVVGTIVTYELVMFQFNNGRKAPPVTNNETSTIIPT